MHPVLSQPRTLYGLAFPIEDLGRVRHWAGERGLRVHVSLDSVIDGMEFEELLILAPRHSRRRTLAIWRTLDGVFGQAPGQPPQGFDSVAELLGQVRPARARLSWRQRLGLA